MQKYETVFLKISCWRKKMPLNIAFNLDQMKGVEVFWSNSCKYPNEEECEGHYELQQGK